MTQFQTRGVVPNSVAIATWLWPASDVLAGTIFGEAGEEPYPFKVALGHVILNRAKLLKPIRVPLRAVCLAHDGDGDDPDAKWAFDCWGMRLDYIVNARLDRGELWNANLDLAMNLLAGSIPDITSGADRYEVAAAAPLKAVRGPTAAIAGRLFWRGT